MAVLITIERTKETTTGKKRKTMISKKVLTIRHHRRAFQAWSFENGHDLSSRENWDAAISGYGASAGLDNDTLDALYVAHAEQPRVVTAAYMD